MTRQEKGRLIETCLSKSRDIDLDRAYLLASMAVYGQPLDDNYTDDEYRVWSDYRNIVLGYLESKRDSA